MGTAAPEPKYMTKKITALMDWSARGPKGRKPSKSSGRQPAHHGQDQEPEARVRGAEQQAVANSDQDHNDHDSGGGEGEHRQEDRAREDPSWHRHRAVSSVNLAGTQLGKVDRQTHDDQVRHDGADQPGKHDVDEPDALVDSDIGVRHPDEQVDHQRERQAEEDRNRLSQQQEDLVPGPDPEGPDRRSARVRAGQRCRLSHRSRPLNEWSAAY